MFIVITNFHVFVVTINFQTYICYQDFSIAFALLLSLGLGTVLFFGAVTGLSLAGIILYANNEDWFHISAIMSVYTVYSRLFFFHKVL